MTLVNGKVALVTGASSGIGEATALKLQSLGYTVYGAARRVERMAGLADRGIHTLAMDVTDEASMQAGVEQIIAAEGRIDVLVNSAGYGSYGAIEDVPIAEARRQFEVNLFGVARLSQLVLPAMRRSRTFGLDLVAVGSEIVVLKWCSPYYQTRSSPTAPLRTAWLSSFGFRHLATWLDHLRNPLTP